MANRGLGQPAGGLVVVQGDTVLGKPRGHTWRAVPRELRPTQVGGAVQGDVVGGDLPLAGRELGARAALPGGSPVLPVAAGGYSPGRACPGRAGPARAGARSCGGEAGFAGAGVATAQAASRHQMGQGRAFQGLLAPGARLAAYGISNGAVRAWAVFSWVRQRAGRLGRPRAGAERFGCGWAAGPGPAMFRADSVHRFQRGQQFFFDHAFAGVQNRGALWSRYSVPSASSCWMDCCGLQRGDAVGSCCPARAALVAELLLGAAGLFVFGTALPPLPSVAGAAVAAGGVLADRAGPGCMGLFQPVSTPPSNSRHAVAFM